MKYDFFDNGAYFFKEEGVTYDFVVTKVVAVAIRQEGITMCNHQIEHYDSLYNVNKRG
jgi:hypothetical protein